LGEVYHLMPMTKFTKAALDKAVDELKRNGYMVLIVMLDQKADQTKQMGNAVEVLCSETNDPRMLKAMLQTTLAQLCGPVEADHRIN
jgi:hypothetical protein